MAVKEEEPNHLKKPKQPKILKLSDHKTQEIKEKMI